MRHAASHCLDGIHVPCSRKSWPPSEPWIAETTGCPSYVVHLASARALEACHDGRRRGVPVYVETRPIYLHLTRQRFEEEDGAKYAGAPPLRDQADVDALWAGLQFGNIDSLATDHAPWMLAEKLDPSLDATNLRQGVADLETCLRYEADRMVRSAQTDDYTEAVAAFGEKRTPHFQGN